MREVVGLRWVRRLEERPGCIPKGRPRGAKARGVRFEGAVAEVFPEAEVGALHSLPPSYSYIPIKIRLLLSDAHWLYRYSPLHCINQH